DASSALVVGDFAFSISGGTATLSSATPSSISASGNIYTLGIGLSGTPDGSEVLTVVPVDDGIYDGAGNEASTSQSNNTATLNDQAAPATPTYLFATPGNTQVVLNWRTNSESDLASFKVYGGTSASPTTLLSTISSGTETYTNTGLTNATTYYYRVSAVDNTGNESAKTTDIYVTPDNPTATAPSGSGTSADPYQIATLANLNWISQSSDRFDDHFIQTADIDAASTSSWYGGAGFFPIGATSPYFTGIYDGGNYKISNLYINSPNIFYIGLFGVNYGSNAVLKNLGLINVNITVGNVVGDSYGGGLAAYNYKSDIENCYVTGNITTHEDGDTGLLIGMNNLGTVSKCYSSGTVTAQAGTNVGGLVGHNYKATVKNSFSTGTVIGSKKVGGLVGVSYSNGTDHPLIENSYSRSNVTGSTYQSIGGLLGEHGYQGGTVTNSFSTGTVTSGSSGDWDAVGGFSGTNTTTANTSINASFWDTESSGKSTGIGSGTTTGVTGKTTSEMKTLSTFTDAGWDFIGESTNGSNDYWTIDGTNNDGYPYLSWQDFLAPTISSVSLASDNSTIAVTMNEAVYNTNGGSGSLEASDFAFSINGGTATLSSATPSSISANGNVYTLGISLSGTPDGSETLTVNPASATAIYDAAGNAAAASQSNNTATLNDQTAP
ncbi:MAG: fibronectin type III domain-containing protein, partial [Anaerolineales bacterium]|nr:fibronectin type III domain-containing protein [Anaerolineales bacterium]